MDGYSTYGQTLRKRRAFPKFNSPALKRRVGNYRKYAGRPGVAGIKPRYKARPASKKAKIVRRKVTPGDVLSPCSKHYFDALYNPWNVKEAPCIPDAIQVPSQKMSTRIRGTMRTNSNGIGYIILNPYVPVSTQAESGNNPAYLAPVWATNGLGTHSGIRVPPLVAPGSLAASTEHANPYYHNSQITGPNMADAMADSNFNFNDWRPVAGGIKVQYAGQLEDRSGSYILFEAPVNDNFLGITDNLSDGAVLQNEEAAFTVVAEAPVAVTHKVRNGQDVEYASEWYDYASGAGNTDDLVTYHTMMIAVFGCVSQAFNFEVIMHWEFVGSSFPARTRSHSDPTGFARINNTSPTAPSKATPEKTLFNKGAELVNDVLAFSQTPGGRAIGNMVFSAYESLRPPV